MPYFHDRRSLQLKLFPFSIHLTIVYIVLILVAVCLVSAAPFCLKIIVMVTYFKTKSKIIFNCSFVSVQVTSRHLTPHWWIWWSAFAGPSPRS